MVCRMRRYTFRSYTHPVRSRRNRDIFSMGKRSTRGLLSSVFELAAFWPIDVDRFDWICWHLTKSKNYIRVASRRRCRGKGRKLRAGLEKRFRVNTCGGRGEGTCECNLVNMFDDELAWKSMAAAAAARDGSAGEGSATTIPVAAAYTTQTTPGRWSPDDGVKPLARFTFPVDVRRTRVWTGKFPVENERTECLHANDKLGHDTRTAPGGKRAKNIVVETRRKRRTRARHVNRSVRTALHTAGRGVRNGPRRVTPLRRRPPGQSPPARPGVLAGATGPARVPPIGRRFAATRPVRRRYRHVFSPPPSHVLPPLWHRVPPPDGSKCFEFVAWTALTKL